jgi:2-oxoglutarate ferredoxin oxidoreductase subunit delta
MRRADLGYVGSAMRRRAGVVCAQRERVAPVYDVNVLLHPTALFSDSRRRTGHICRKARDIDASGAPVHAPCGTPLFVRTEPMPSESPPGVRPSPPARPKKAPPEIKVRMSWCKGCGLCVDYCKPEAIAMDGAVPHVIAAEKCTRCLQCEAICPDFAIEVIDLPVEVRTGSAET